MNRIYLKKGKYHRGDKALSQIRYALSHYLEKEGKDPSIVNQVKLDDYQKGKPYLKYVEEDSLAMDLPEISISHSGAYWVILFSDEPCGIDIQEKKGENNEKIARRVFNDDEALYVESGGNDAFFRLWTMREAYGKMTGEGFFIEYSSFISKDGTPINEIHYGGNRYYITEIDVDENYSMTMVAESPEYQVIDDIWEDNNIDNEDLRSKAQDDAPKKDIGKVSAYYISLRERSVKELKDYLRKKGYDQDEIDKTAADLIEYGLLDDKKYGESFFRYGENKGWGRTRIIRELKKRGVSPPEEYESAESELERAIKVAEKMVSEDDLNERGHLEEKVKARVGRRLYSYGYSSSIIFSVIDEIEKSLK